MHLYVQWGLKLLCKKNKSYAIERIIKEYSSIKLSRWKIALI